MISFNDSLEAKLEIALISRRKIIECELIIDAITNGHVSTTERNIVFTSNKCIVRCDITQTDNYQCELETHSDVVYCSIKEATFFSMVEIAKLL